MCEALKLYLSKRKLTIAGAARELGEHRETVRTWLNGTIPRKRQVKDIYRWSKGQVQPNDFYDLSVAEGHEELPLFNQSYKKAAGQ